MNEVPGGSETGITEEQEGEDTTEVKYDVDIEFVRERAAPFEKLFADFPMTIGQAVSKKERDEKGNEERH